MAFCASGLSGIDRIQPSGVYGSYSLSGAYFENKQLPFSSFAGAGQASIGDCPPVAAQRDQASPASPVRAERGRGTNQIGGAADNLNGGRNLNRARNLDGARNLNGIRSLDGTENPNESRNLSEVCRDFEAIFLQYLIREMRASVPKDDLFDGGFQEEVFMSLFDESLAKELAKRGGIGIGDMLVKQLSESSRIVHPAAKAPVIGKSEGNQREGNE